MFKNLQKNVEQHMQELKAFHEDESGDVIQFIALTALILVMLVGGFFVLKPLIKQNFDNAETQLNKVNGDGNSYE